jgi:hypothetical protein
VVTSDNTPYLDIATFEAVRGSFKGADEVNPRVSELILPDGKTASVVMGRHYEWLKGPPPRRNSQGRILEGETHAMLVYPPELAKLGGPGLYEFKMSLCYSISKPVGGITLVSMPLKGTSRYFRHCEKTPFATVKLDIRSTKVANPVIDVVRPASLPMAQLGKTIPFKIVGRNLTGKQVGGVLGSSILKMSQLSVSKQPTLTAISNDDKTLSADVDIRPNTQCGPHTMVVSRSLPGQGYKLAYSSFNLHKGSVDLVVMEGENAARKSGNFTVYSIPGTSGKQAIALPPNARRTGKNTGLAMWMFEVPKDGDYRIFIRSRKWVAIDNPGGQGRINRQKADGTWVAVPPNGAPAVKSWNWDTVAGTSFALSFLNRTGSDSFNLKAGTLYQLVLLPNSSRDLPVIDMVLPSPVGQTPTNRDVCF